ncbi:hypothetical protein JHK82_039948 [Glycine max]|nr:hypothetical protein JHK82_039948 [Glycine max]
MSSTCKCSPRETIHVVKEVRVALVVVMNPMTNNSMDSIVLFGDNFKDLNNKCNTIGHASKKSKCNSEQNKKTQEGVELDFSQFYNKGVFCEDIAQTQIFPILGVV